MKIITDDMLYFKEAARHIWNTYFLQTALSTPIEAQNSRGKIERELFYSLVLNKHSMPELAEKYRDAPMPIFLHAKAGLNEVPVQFGDMDEHRNVIWQLPCIISAPEISAYKFIEFFDWNPYEHIDMFYVKASVGDGRFALIAQTYTDFVLRNDRSNDD